MRIQGRAVHTHCGLGLTGAAKPKEAESLRQFLARESYQPRPMRMLKSF